MPASFLDRVRRFLGLNEAERPPDLPVQEQLIVELYSK